MKLACNIDKRGRLARLVTGSLVVVGGVALIVAEWWAVGLLAIVAGGFAIFEGARGWCALRAMGLKTKL